MSAERDNGSDTRQQGNSLKEQRALEWLERVGARFDRVRLGHLDNGERGIFARTDIPAGAEVLRVPRECMLTVASARDSDIGRLILAHAPDVSEESILAAFLLQEREREDSPWKSYFELLPADFSHLPLFFGASELALLKGSTLPREIGRWRELLLGQYARLCESVPGFTRYLPDAFLWAQFVLLSRTFGATLEGRFVRCFVPLADMLNHRQSPEAQWGMTEDESAFVMVARKDISAGQELHISYGAKPNYRFLLNYGFVPEYNADDELLLHLGVPEEVVGADEKRRLLSLTHPEARRRFGVPLRSEHVSTVALFSFLRVVCAGEEELVRLIALAGTPEGLGPVDPLSPETEARVFQLLGEHCEARLAGFETTLEEDEQLLQQEDLRPNTRHCLLVRRGEKRLLHAYAGLARTFLPLLRGPSPDPGVPGTT